MSWTNTIQLDRTRRASTSPLPADPRRRPTATRNAASPGTETHPTTPTLFRGTSETAGWQALSDGSSRECYHATETGGERVEREQILARLRERIVRFAASHLSRDAAEDLAQEVLLLLHEKYAHLERVEDLLPLSLQIVRFKIMSQRRKSVRHGEYTQVSITDIQLPDLDANPAEYVERKQMLERLARAMSGLGDRCRELLRLKLEGKAFPEIQKIMGVAAINT